MTSGILIGILFLYCISLNLQIKKLKYFAKYGSPKCEKNISALWEMAEEQREKTMEHGSRLSQLEQNARVHL